MTDTRTTRVPEPAAEPDGRRGARLLLSSTGTSRRPVDVAVAATGLLLVLAGIAAASGGSGPLDSSVGSVAGDLPGVATDLFDVAYALGAGCAALGVTLALLTSPHRGRCPSPWRSPSGARRGSHDLAASSEGRSDVIRLFELSTALRDKPREATELLIAPSLSPWEREVLSELARGATYADIAHALFVSENTGTTHVSSLYGKLGGLASERGARRRPCAPPALTPTRVRRAAAAPRVTRAG